MYDVFIVQKARKSPSDFFNKLSDCWMYLCMYPVVEVQNVGLFLSKFLSRQAKVLRYNLENPYDTLFYNSVADVCTVLLGFTAKTV